MEVFQIMSDLDVRNAMDKNLKPLLLLPYLRSHGVLTQIEYDRINDPGTIHQDKVFLIIDAVVSKDRKALDTFIEALKKTENSSHQELAEMFDKVLCGHLTSEPVNYDYSLVDDVITPHFPAVMNSLNLTALLWYLQKYQLLTGEEVERLSSPVLTTAGCNRYIFSRLYRCGADAVENFIRCLIEEETHPPHRELAMLLIRELSTQEQYLEQARRLDLALTEAGARSQQPFFGKHAHPRVMW